MELHRHPDVDVAKLKWMQRAAEKMRLLFKHHKIDPSDEQSWEKLAIRLAFEHVPGLQLAFRPKPGRKPTWKTGLGDELVRAVEDVKSRTGKRTEDAIAKLKEEPGGMWGRYTVENLGARYRERGSPGSFSFAEAIVECDRPRLGPSAHLPRRHHWAGCTR